MKLFFNRLNQVRQIPIFAKLNWFEQQRIARKSTIVHYRKGEIICREGDPPDNFYCLVSGRLQAYTCIDGGLKDNIDFIHRGMHFGVISTLTGENHSLTYEAINDSVILQIPREDFHNILRVIPSLGVELSQNLSKRIRRNVEGKKSVFESNIITIYSPVVGTGSSTYAMNLALSLERETRKKVIYVTIHSRIKKATAGQIQMAGASPKWKEGAVSLADIVGDHEHILRCVQKGNLNIDVINVAFDVEDQSVKKQIAPFVSALVGDYHYVVVDLPNDMDEVVVEALAQSDLVHLIVTDRKKDMDEIKRVINRLRTTLKVNFKVERVRVLIRAHHDKVYFSFEEINQYLEYEVYNSLPVIHQEQLKGDVSSDVVSFQRLDPKSQYGKAVTRIAREIGGVMVGLCLGGGAALGVAHVGVIRVLEQENIPIDVIVGSSMGALIGGIWAVGKDADGLEKVAAEFEKKINILKLFDPVIPISGLIGGRLIRHWLKKHIGTRTFYNTRIPFKVVAYDLVRREEIIIQSGLIIDAIRESIAIPGVIEPVKKKGQVIIDGGVLNPLPTNVLTALGIKKIIAVNVLQSPEDVSEGHDMEQQKLAEKAAVPMGKAPFQYISFRFGRLLSKLFSPNISDIIVRTLQATEYVIAEQSAQQADIVIHPDLVGINWFELDRYRELIKAGEEATRQQLSEIKQLVFEG